MQHFCSTNLWIWIGIYFYRILLDKSWTTSTTYFDHKQILLPLPYGILREVENAYLFIYLFTAHTLQIVKPPCVKKEELIKRPGPRVHSKIEILTNILTLASKMFGLRVHFSKALSFCSLVILLVGSVCISF